MTYVALGALAWRFERTRPGTSAAYWDYLCRVRLPSIAGRHERARWSGVYPVVGDKAYYYDQLEHSKILYSVPVASVLQDAASVRATLDDVPLPSAPGDRDDGSAERRQACASLLRSSEANGLGEQQLEELRVALGRSVPVGLLAVGADVPDSLGQAADGSFRDRLDRADRVWVACAFEAAYLGAWFWFVAGRWPLRVHWRWRALLAPFLLFVPYFLGYAPQSLTYAPSGGFVYPSYVFFAAIPMTLIPCTRIDAILWRHVPLVLGRFSLVAGDPRGESSLGCVGPLSPLVLGAALLLLLSVVVAFHGWLHSERTPPRISGDDGA